MAERITDCELLPHEEWGDGWELRRERSGRLAHRPWIVNVGHGAYLDVHGRLVTGVCVGHFPSKEEAEKVLLLWLMTRAGG